MKRVVSAGRKRGNTCATDSKRGWTGGKRGKSHMTNDNGSWFLISRAQQAPSSIFCTCQLCLVIEIKHNQEIRKYDRNIYLYAVLSSSVLVMTTSVIFALGFSSLAR